MQTTLETWTVTHYGMWTYLDGKPRKAAKKYMLDEFYGLQTRLLRQGIYLSSMLTWVYHPKGLYRRASLGWKTTAMSFKEVPCAQGF